MAPRIYLAARRKIVEAADRVINRADVRARLAFSTSPPFRSSAARAGWLQVGRVAHVLKLFPRVDAVEWLGHDGTSAIYAGDPYLMPEVRRLLFANRPDERQVGRVALAHVRAFVRAALAGYDIVVVGLPWPVSDRIRPAVPWCATVPALVDHVLDVSRPVTDMIRGRSREHVRTMVRAALRLGLTFRTTTDAGEVTRFYNEVYCPYLTQRHGDLVRANSLAAQVERLADGRGELVWVDLGGQLVGGKIMQHVGDRSFNEEAAACLGLVAEVAKIVPSALLYAGVLRAQQRGSRALHLGGSLSQYADPVFSAKRRWGAAVCSRDRSAIPRWSFLAARPSPLLLRLNAAGLVSVGGEGSTVIQFGIPGHSVRRDWPGIDRVSLVGPAAVVDTQ